MAYFLSSSSSCFLFFLDNYNYKNTTTDYPQHNPLFHKQFSNWSHPYMHNKHHLSTLKNKTILTALGLHDIFDKIFPLDAFTPP